MHYSYNIYLNKKIYPRYTEKIIKNKEKFIKKKP